MQCHHIAGLYFETESHIPSGALAFLKWTQLVVSTSLDGCIDLASKVSGTGGDGIVGTKQAADSLAFRSMAGELAHNHWCQVSSLGLFQHLSLY